MSRLTFDEQTWLARLRLDRSRRAAVARVNRSLLLRWRYGAPVADNLLIIPQELRAGDPSFAGEIEFGHFGLGGWVASLDDESPFAIEPPSKAWARELHGFGWLRHLQAAGSDAARASARALVADWRRLHARHSGLAWEPAVTGRRLISWIVNAPLLLDGVDDATFDAITDSLGDQLIHLSATWPGAPDGYPRLLALTALLMGELCIAGHEHKLDEVEAGFAGELDRQIVSDGGHVSRNPEVPIELLLDFLPLRQCYASRDRGTPAALDAAIARMLLMIRFMRLGDGRLCRFNGVSASGIDAQSAVLAYDSAPEGRLERAPSSAYVRAERGGTVVILDAGGPPPLEQAGTAHAGCLSFEMSTGAHAIFVNCGAPPSPDSEWAASARATASHNTLCLCGQSSSKLVRHPLLESLLGAAPIRFPDDVKCSVIDHADGGIEIGASHDGYVQRFALVHSRRLVLSADGRRLSGHDRIASRRGPLRLTQDLPFAIHFHLDTDVVCVAGKTGRNTDLKLKDGSRWRLSVEGAVPSIEDSLRFALAGPIQARQVVLRGATFGETEVRWVVEKCTDDPGPRYPSLAIDESVSA